MTHDAVLVTEMMELDNTKIRRVSSAGRRRSRAHVIEQSSVKKTNSFRNFGSVRQKQRRRSLSALESRTLKEFIDFVESRKLGRKSADDVAVKAKSGRVPELSSMLVLVHNA